MAIIPIQVRGLYLSVPERNIQDIRRCRRDLHVSISPSDRPAGTQDGPPKV